MRSSAEELLSELERNGVLLSLRGDRLVVNAPKGLLTPADKDELRQSKQTLMEVLRARKKQTSERALTQGKHQPNEKTLSLSADKFLAKVTKGLKVGVAELLRLGIITEQDISDLDAGMYSSEHIDDYRALVEQQLRLKLVSGSNTK